MELVLDHVLRHRIPVAGGSRHGCDLTHRRLKQRMSTGTRNKLAHGDAQNRAQGVEGGVPQQLGPSRADDILDEDAARVGLGFRGRQPGSVHIDVERRGVVLHCSRECVIDVVEVSADVGHIRVLMIDGI